jgi:hypothetical protein
MAWNTQHPRTDILRYIEGEMATEEESAVKKHLEGCPDCRDYLSFVGDFKKGLKELGPEEIAPREPCPDSETLVAYDAGELDEETARHVRVHTVFCESCMRDLYGLRQLRAPSWTEAVVGAVLRAGRATLECLSISGSGDLEPQYALATKGEAEAPSNELRIADTVADPGTGSTSDIRVKITTEAGTPPGIALLVQADPLQPLWKACLLGPDERELASIPLDAPEAVLGARLPYGSYTVNVTSKDEILARFAIGIRPQEDIQEARPEV